MGTNVKLTSSTRHTLLSMQSANTKTAQDERTDDKPTTTGPHRDIIQITGKSLTQAEKMFAQMRGATLLAESAPSIPERQELVERLSELRRSLNALGAPSHGYDHDIDETGAYRITRTTRWALVETPVNLAGHNQQALLGMF